MANVRTSIEIAVPPERVWEFVTDLDRLGEWVSIHRDFPEPPPAEVREGTMFQQTVELAGTPFPVEWTAIEVDGPHRLAWEGTGPAGAIARTTYSLSAETGGTRFAYENEFELPGGGVTAAAGRVVSGYAEGEADASLSRLKQLAEG